MPQLFVKLPTADTATRTIQFDANCGARHLQAAVRGMLADVDVDQFVCYLTSGGAPLSLLADDDDSNWERLLLTASNDESAPVSVCISRRLPGGKTHGRLGNAGKVRRQTPVVAKATDSGSKPRQKTGRARKRQLCRRRFGERLEAQLADGSHA